MMKKILSVFMIIALVFAFAGCSANTGSSKSTSADPLSYIFREQANSTA